MELLGVVGEYAAELYAHAGDDSSDMDKFEVSSLRIKFANSGHLVF